jgi:hypothetical protein
VQHLRLLPILCRTSAAGSTVRRSFVSGGMGRRGIAKAGVAGRKVGKLRRTASTIPFEALDVLLVEIVGRHRIAGRQEVVREGLAAFV